MMLLKTVSSFRDGSTMHAFGVDDVVHILFFASWISLLSTRLRLLVRTTNNYLESNTSSLHALESVNQFTRARLGQFI